MSREIRLQEVKKHDNSNSLWMVIHNEVYDVTKFIDEHPGGAESLLDFAGKDGTEGFEDVGHSQDARELLKQYKIGVLPKDECNVAPCCKPNNTKKKKKSSPVGDYNKDCMVYATSTSCGPDEPFENKSKKQFRSKRTPTPHKCDLLGPPTPRVTGRNNAIVVPRDRSKLKMALLALAGALIIGIVIKKYVINK